MHEFGRDLFRRQIRLHPGVSVQLANLIIAAHEIPFAALIADHHPRGNPLAAEHERQRRGKVFAVPQRLFREEVFNRVDVRIAVSPDERVLEPPGSGQLLLQECTRPTRSALGRPDSSSQRLARNATAGKSSSAGIFRTYFVTSPGSAGTRGFCLPSTMAVVAST